MPNRKAERLKKLLQAVPPEAPAPEFTARVMDDVRAVAGPETATDPALEALLRRNGLETPSAHFTRVVMEGVAAARPVTPAGTPIIPTGVWYGAAAFLVGLVAWAMAAGSAAGPPREATFWSEVVRGLVRAFSTGVQAVPASYVLVVGAAGVLLGIEYVLRYNAGPRAARSGVGGQ